MSNTEVERYNGVDVEEVPSAQWGWSKENPRLIHILGIASGLFLLSMMIGHHVGHVEDIFVVIFAALIFYFVGRDWLARRRGWYR